jgi:hypothetical protein
VPYNKAEVKQLIASELGWQDYGGKHEESVFTRFYQGYILPRKFGIDKRKAHLSNLIFAGQITKAEALAELARPPYDPSQMESDYQFVVKKLRLSTEEFEKIMATPPRPHTDFKTEKGIFDSYPPLKIFRRPINLITSRLFRPRA